MHYLVKIGSISFFVSSDMRKHHHLLKCHAFDVAFLAYLFLSTLSFLNLLYQAKSLMRTIISGSS